MTMIFAGEYRLDFQLEQSPIADQWLEKMNKRHRWPLDDPRRFYGFDDPGFARQDAERRLKECINTINSYQPVMCQEWTSVDDQDLLNYLHNIFERYHGLLDKQDTEWWRAAPQEVRKALANLNIYVHRAESVTRGSYPRLVCTWFGMPKDSFLDKDLMEKYGVLNYEFGGVYLNYVEIGKTIEDLEKDNDQYIGEDAFQPFQHYSADFNVRFYDSAVDLARISGYFETHQEFFQAKGIQSFRDHRIMPWRYKVAQLESNIPRDDILTAIRLRQHVTDIYFT